MSKTVKNNNEIAWYNNPNMITSFIIGLIALIVLLSQSFAIKNNLSPVTMLGSILNHNIMYLLVCIYFISLKTKTGKKYFDFLNIFLIMLYTLSAITSLLTVFQSFGLSSLLGFSIDILILIYLFHTLLRSTRLWESANLGKSPFNEITNNGYFSTIVVLAITLLAVDLISSTSLDGTILSLLDTAYVGLFVRYIFLYGEFLDSRKISINNVGNFNEIKEKISDSVDNFVEKHDLDDKVENIKEIVNDFSSDMKEKVVDIKEDLQEKIEKVDFEEKFEQTKKNINSFVNDVSDNVTELKEDLVKKYEESDLDEAVNMVKEVVNNLTNDIKEEATEIKESIAKKIEESDLDDTVKEFSEDLKEKAIDVKNKVFEKYEEKTSKEKIANDVKSVKTNVSSKPKSEITSRKKNTRKNKSGINNKNTSKKVNK